MNGSLLGRIASMREAYRECAAWFYDERRELIRFVHGEKLAILVDEYARAEMDEAEVVFARIVDALAAKS